MSDIFTQSDARHVARARVRAAKRAGAAAVRDKRAARRAVRRPPDADAADAAARPAGRRLPARPRRERVAMPARAAQNSPAEAAGGHVHHAPHTHQRQRAQQGARRVRHLGRARAGDAARTHQQRDRKSTRLNSSH